MPLCDFQILFKRDSMVMHRILRTINERNDALTHVALKLLDGFGVVAEFEKVALSKLGSL